MHASGRKGRRFIIGAIIAGGEGVPEHERRGACNCGEMWEVIHLLFYSSRTRATTDIILTGIVPSLGAAGRYDSLSRRRHHRDLAA